ncbi:MAG: hypothetical protein K2Y10_08665 [Burkholderiaceae bacterium]|nr:hypothetical protein [Burkholderiaceae bacterium]
MKRFLHGILWMLALCVVGPAPVLAADAPKTATFSTLPKAKPGGKWKIAYYEGGQYPDYEVILKATVRGMVALGWIQPLDIPEHNNSTPGGFWAYLVKNAKSRYVEFVPDGYYSAGNFDRDLRPKVKAELLGRLANKRDIDLVIAMGTWAGQDLANDQHQVPVVVASTSDPIGSHIVTSAQDSGRDHIHAKVEPDRYARQIELFHDIIGFHKLGLVYEDSPEGRTFAAVDAIERTAKARKFEVVRCLAPFNDVPQQEAEAKVVACYEKLSKEVDAVYLTVHRGLNSQSLPKVVKPLLRYQRPSFSMLGEGEVKRGVLMSVAQGNYTYVGHFHAETIARIFNGAKPRQLSQIWLAPAKIALNLKVAEAISYDPPVDILLACDDIFQKIE